MEAPHGSWSLRGWLALAGVSLASLPLPARAQQDDGWALIKPTPALVALEVLVIGEAVGAATYAVADTTEGVQGRWLSPVPAALELGLVGVPWLGLGIFSAAQGFGRAPVTNTVVLGLGTALTAHAILSLALYEPVAGRSREQALAAPAVRVAPVLAPGLAGAALAARF
jgi:hypothetical protein